jgi:hypothetical protein
MSVYIHIPPDILYIYYLTELCAYIATLIVTSLHFTEIQPHAVSEG